MTGEEWLAWLILYPIKGRAERAKLVESTVDRTILSEEFARWFEKAHGGNHIAMTKTVEDPVALRSAARRYLAENGPPVNSYLTSPYYLERSLSSGEPVVSLAVRVGLDPDTVLERAEAYRQQHGMLLQRQ